MPRRAELPNLGPARLDLSVYRGDSLSVKVRLQSQGVRVDVSQWMFESFIRTGTEGNLLGSFTPYYDIVHGADAPNGIIVLWLSPYISQVLPALSVWDLQTSIDSRVMTLLRGNIVTTSDVTYSSNPAGRYSVSGSG